MLCPFLKNINYYDLSGIYSAKRQDAGVQKESFSKCYGPGCMAYGEDSSSGRSYCKLIKQKN